jgi:hypothetical protein
LTMVTRLLLAFALLRGVRGAIKGKPHGHQGKLKPFVPGEPSVTISKSDQARLDAGEMLISQTKDAGSASGRATAIQTMHAPPKTVWNQLLDFNAYPKKVDKLVEVHDDAAALP